MKYPFKLYDTKDIAAMGRVEKQWYGHALKEVFRNTRKGPAIAPKLITDPDQALLTFNLKGFEFGNWLNQEDRWEYYIGAVASLVDMAKIIGFRHNQIGLGKRVSLAFGARGSSRAVAHFEPWSFAINMTRYREVTKREGKNKYLLSGGVGSLGHEWAHALDFACGRFLDRETPHNFLSNTILGAARKSSGNSYVVKKNPYKGLAKDYYALMVKIKYQRTGKQKKLVPGTDGYLYKRTKFYDDLTKLVEDPSNPFGTYWLRNEELLARAFEVYLFYKGKAKRIQNPYLRKTKYVAVFYSNQAHYKTWEAEMTAILSKAQKLIKVKF